MLVPLRRGTVMLDPVMKIAGLVTARTIPGFIGWESDCSAKRIFCASPCAESAGNPDLLGNTCAFSSSTRIDLRLVSNAVSDGSAAWLDV